MKREDLRPLTTYWLDPDNRIARVCEAWDSFARANNGEAALGVSVVGRPLADFVTGDVTRMWVNALLTLGRLRNSPVERPYRCDSPDEERYMSLRIVPEESGFLRVEHILHTAQRRPEPLFVRPALFQRQPHHRRCSVCSRVLQDGKWVAPEHARDLKRRADGAELRVIYSVCEDCLLMLPQCQPNPTLRPGSAPDG